MRRFWIVRHDRPALLFLTLVLLSFLAIGCGGGSGSISTPPPPAGDFTVSIAPASLSIGIGGSQTITVSATEVNTFTSSIGISLSGLPAGVTASPGTFQLMPGAQQKLSLTAAATAVAVTAPITVTGTSGSTSHSAQASLSVVAAISSAHAPIRARYLRTDSFYNPNSLQFSPPRFTVYDAAHKQFFVSNPYKNEIDVFDAAREIQTAQIPIPMPWGIDISPYNGSLYAGTQIGDIYQIDTATLTVTARHLSASIGPNGYMATMALVLADGRLALQGAGDPLIGYLGTVIWDPATNSLDAGPSTYNSICPLAGGGLALSGDRMRILSAGVGSSSVSASVCSYDPVSRTEAYGSLPTPSGSFVREIIPTPDGSRFFLTTNLQGVAVFDAKTAQLLTQIQGASPYTGIPSAAAGGVVSLDGKTLYLADQFGTQQAGVGAYDTSTYLQTGWIPSFTVVDGQATIVPGAIDETGLIVGPMGHGVGFMDGSQLKPTKPTFPGDAAFSPNTGSSAGGTPIGATTWIDNIADFQIISDGATLNDIYVGNLPGQGASLTACGADTCVEQVTTPFSDIAGPVDIALVMSDGGVDLTPEGFSYGPSILSVIPNGATAEGGQLGAIIGYGFGNAPSGVQVTVGGKSASVLAVNEARNLYLQYPFPTEFLQFVIPPGTSGEVADVTVTTPSGSTTAAGAFHYTPPTQSFPLRATLQSGIYDAGRNLYYFADLTQIQVFSPSAGAWQPAITLPGITAATKLLAIAESPDGSKLALSDFGGQAIYLLNPGSPASAHKFPMSLDNDFFSSLLAPGALAVTNAGIVYVLSSDIGGTGAPGLQKLDSSAATITDIGNGVVTGGSRFDRLNRVLLNASGSRVYINNGGLGFWIDTATDQVHRFNSNQMMGITHDLAVSGDGNTIDFGEILMDASFNPETEPAYIDWETWLPSAVLGPKLSHDGSILFQPLSDGIDLIARNTGRLLYRIQIPVTPANVYDPFVAAKAPGTFAVVTATGITFVDLSGLPIPASDTLPFADATHSQGNPQADWQPVQAAPRPQSNRPMNQPPRPDLRRNFEPTNGPAGISR